MRLAGRELPSVGQIYLLDNPLLREPLRPEHVKPRLLGHWGTTPGPEPPLRAPEPGHPRARPRGALRHRARPRRAGPRRQHVARGHLQRGLSRASAATRRACAGCSASSRSPAASRATSRRRRPARSTRAASSATRWRTPTAPRSTTRTCVVLLRRRRRRGRDRPARRELALEQVPRPGARRRRAADPAPQRLQDRQPDGAGPHPARRAAPPCSRATATARSSSRATTRRTCTRQHGRRARRRARRDRRDPAPRAREAATATGRAGR